MSIVTNLGKVMYISKLNNFDIVKARGIMKELEKNIGIQKVLKYY